MNVRQKKLVLDARKTSNAFVPVKVTNEPAEVAINFKYICTLIDNKLSFSDKTDLVYKKKLKKKKSNACTSCASWDLLMFGHELLQIVYRNLVHGV